MDDEISPDSDYDVIKCTHTPEEEQKIRHEALKELVENARD